MTPLSVSTAPPEVQAALIAGLRQTAGAGGFSSQRVQVSHPMQVFTISAAGLNADDLVSSAKTDTWRYFVFDAAEVLTAEVGSELLELVSGAAVLASLQACSALDRSGAAGNVRVLSCPLIGREAIWLDGPEEGFWTVLENAETQRLSREELSSAWKERASRLGIGRTSDLMDEKDHRDEE